VPLAALRDTDQARLPISGQATSAPGDTDYEAVTKPNQRSSVMASQNEIRERITTTIVEALKSGKLAPWRIPWAADPAAGPPDRRHAT
jgi:hypothetical protein